MTANVPCATSTPGRRLRPLDLARSSSREDCPRSGTSLRATSPMDSSPGFPGHPATRPRPLGSSQRLPSGLRTPPTCSPTTTRQRWISPAQPGRPSRSPSTRHPSTRCSARRARESSRRQCAPRWPTPSRSASCALPAPSLRPGPRARAKAPASTARRL
jgi:hypothetical protein